MNKWMRKTLVILFTIATFGMVAPPAALTVEEHSSEDSTAKLTNSDKYFFTDETAYWQRPKESCISTFVEAAEVQSFQKFGDRIGTVIEDEFRQIILPKIEEAIKQYVEEYSDEDIRELAISKKPADGKGEKIFHLYNKQTGQDVLRFHVRRDHPPKQGYWFNFHYHTHHDSFQKHHELGSIYWNQNMPPNWMTH
ncbi:YpjP family protein [Bacillus sp. CMF21]|nr:YpjP family protein [Bacillus sp. OVS6]USK31068.1 YpjP family protein [Bacillus sp. CMF21]